MSGVAVVGMQWGDEGKGKVVDLISPSFAAVVRYQGGHNAGHTVKFGDRHFALHLIPSGILSEQTLCVLGNGMVIHPPAFLDEVDELEEAGIVTRDRLFVSDRAQLLLDFHVALDTTREQALGKHKIGTTSRGIGPAYEAKAARSGFRLCDLLSENWEDRLRASAARQGFEISDVAERARLLSATVEAAEEWRRRLEPYACDGSRLLNDWLDEGRRLLFEGAQGALLDIDHGTYPFVTSSNTTSGFAATGSGVPPTSIEGVIGVLKAYTTRVGEGPFPSELEDSSAEKLRERGNEYGTTTGRPRRCGWLDLVAARYARRVNGVGAIALTKLDVLDSLDEIPVCVAYRLRGREILDLPSDTIALGEVEPVLQVLPGWEQKTEGLVDYEALPEAAKHYVRFIETFVGAEVALVSTGPKREETVLREHRLLPQVQKL